MMIIMLMLKIMIITMLKIMIMTMLTMCTIFSLRARARFYYMHTNYLKSTIFLLSVMIARLICFRYYLLVSLDV